MFISVFIRKLSRTLINSSSGFRADDNKIEQNFDGTTLSRPNCLDEKFHSPLAKLAELALALVTHQPALELTNESWLSY